MCVGNPSAFRTYQWLRIWGTGDRALCEVREDAQFARLSWELIRMHASVRMSVGRILEDLWNGS